MLSLVVKELITNNSERLLLLHLSMLKKLQKLTLMDPTQNFQIPTDNLSQVQVITNQELNQILVLNQLLVVVQVLVEMIIQNLLVEMVDKLVDIMVHGHMEINVTTSMTENVLKFLIVQNAHSPFQKEAKIGEMEYVYVKLQVVVANQVQIKVLVPNQNQLVKETKVATEDILINQKIVNQMNFSKKKDKSVTVVHGVVNHVNLLIIVLNVIKDSH